MSEEMKLILAFLDYLGLEGKAIKPDGTLRSINEGMFDRKNKEWVYVVQVKP